jgi:holo-[acyl-carrier protein] synthase
MVIGIGSDIIEIDRIKKSSENPGFIRRVYTVREQEYCLSKVRGEQHFAARFAAKEACIKAFGRGFSFQDIEVINDENGKPELLLSGKAREAAIELGVKKSFLTLSHCQGTAIAFVLLEGV